MTETLYQFWNIVNKVKSKYWKWTHKFGLKLPKSSEEALDIDRLVGKNLFRKAIETYMKSTTIIFESHEKEPVGYNKINFHYVFDKKYVFHQ